MYLTHIEGKLVIARRFIRTLKSQTNPKACKFKVNDRFRITTYKNIFSKGYTENWSREISIFDSVSKTNLWIYKIKDLFG